MVKEKMTLERLAGMMARGFDGIRAEMTEKFDGIRAEMTEKFDGIRAEMATKGDLAKVQSIVSTLQGTVNSIETDIKTIKVEIRELNRGSFTEIEKEDLHARVKYIEQKLSITSGK